MKRLSILLAILLSLAACELTVPIELPDQEPKLVINTFISQDTVPVQVQVSQSVGMYDDRDIDTVAGARVFIRVDEEPEMEMTRSPFATFYPGFFHQPNLPIEEGRKYTVRATAPGFKEVQGETVVPFSVKIEKITIEKLARVSNEDSLDAIDITFTDPSGVGNHYGLRIFGLSQWGSSDVCFRASDPLLTDTDVLNNGTDLPSICNGRFTDDLIEGTTYNLRVFLDHREVQWMQGDMFVTLMSIDEAMYNYWESSETQWWNFDNPFAEPVIVSNNIENGYGIVGSFSQSTLKIPY